MTPPDTREAMQIALFNARRLVRDLNQIPADALGIGGATTHHYVRDAAIADAARIAATLAEAMEKEGQTCA